MTVKDDKEIYFDDGNPHGLEPLTDFRVFHKNAVVDSLETGLIECDLNSTDISKIKLEVEDEIPFDSITARAAAVAQIKAFWSTFSVDEVDNKSIEQVLGNG